MDDRLADALAPVLRDLAACGSVVPDVREDHSLASAPSGIAC